MKTHDSAKVTQGNRKLLSTKLSLSYSNINWHPPTSRQSVAQYTEKPGFGLVWGWPLAVYQYTLFWNRILCVWKMTVKFPGRETILITRQNYKMLCIYAMNWFKYPCIKEKTVFFQVINNLYRTTFQSYSGIVSKFQNLLFESFSSGYFQVTMHKNIISESTLHRWHLPYFPHSSLWSLDPQCPELLFHLNWATRLCWIIRLRQRGPDPPAYHRASGTF